MKSEEQTAPGSVGALSIAEFCRRYGVSRTHFYKCRRKGLTPDELEFGKRRLISFHAAEEWRMKMERSPAAESPLGGEKK